MAKAEQNRSKPILLSVAAVIVLIGLYFAVRVFGHSAVEVRVAHVSHQDLLSTVSTNGKVEPVDGAAFQAHAPGPGIVARVFVDVNQKVQPGTLLISLRDADAKARLAGAQSNLAAAESGLADIQGGGSTEELTRFRQDVSAAQLERDHAASDLAAVQALQAKGAASAAEVAQKQQRLQNATASLDNAKSHLGVPRYSSRDLANSNARVADAKAAIAAAQSGLSAIDIRSPIAGTVYSIPISPYDFVRDGDDLMDVADLNRIQIRAYFDEPEIGKLTPGQPVKIVWDAKRDMTWHGHISRAPTTVIPYGTRSVGEALITVDDAHGDLPPNSNVTVTVTTSARNNVLSVPREALHTEGVSDFVYRIVNGHLERTPVQAGILSLTDVEILSGLKDGDDVVLNATAPGQDLTDGLAVRQVP
jgi:HlyD family secretion protein